MVITGRKSPRLKYFDYSTLAAYFITICVQDRIEYLSSVERGEVKLTRFGEIVLATWLSLEDRYAYVLLDHCVVMPDHFHGILMLTPAEEERKPITQLVGAFKTMATKEINLLRKTPGESLFQRSFYEHVVRDEEDLYQCRKYVVENPLRWEVERRGVVSYPWAPDIHRLANRGG